MTHDMHEMAKMTHKMTHDSNECHLSFSSVVCGISCTSFVILKRTYNGAGGEVFHQIIKSSNMFRAITLRMVDGGKSSDTDIAKNQKNTLTHAWNDITDMLGSSDTIIITSFADGIKIRTLSTEDISMKDIIHDHAIDFEEKDVSVLKKFENAPEDIVNAMEFVRWYYGDHRPVTVITFEEQRRAVDMRDHIHVLSRKFIA